MNRLRTLVKIGFLAAVFAGLTSCANFKGDLGADLPLAPESSPVLASKGPAHSLLDVTSPADLPAAEAVEVSADVVDLKDLKIPQVQSVSNNQLTRIPAVPQVPGALQPAATLPVAAQKTDTNDGPKLPDAAQAESVALVEVKKDGVSETAKAPAATPAEQKPVVESKDDKKLTLPEANEAAKLELEKLIAAKAENEKQEAARLAVANAEAEKLLASKQLDEEKAAAAKLASAKAEAERAEAEKLAAAQKFNDEMAVAANRAVAKLEAKRVEAEKLMAAQKLEEEKAEAAKLAAVKLEAERVEAEKLAAAKKIEDEKAEAAKLAAVKLEAERAEAEKLAAAKKLEDEKAEAAKLAAVKLEAERVEAEKLAAAKKLEDEKAEAAKLSAVKLEAERVEAEKVAAAKKLEDEKVEAAKVAAAKLEAETLALAKKLDEEKIEAAKVAAAKLEADRVDADKLAVVAKMQAERLENEKIIAARKLEADKADFAKTPAVIVSAAEQPKPLTNAYLANVADGDAKPAPPPAEETPEQRAARLLKEAEKGSSLQVQTARAEADASYQAGLRAYNMWEYEKALKLFDAALALDPSLREAEDKRKITRSLLNIDVNPIGAKIRALENEKRVEMQEQMISLAHALEEARSYEVRGTETVLDTDAAGKTRVLSDRLRLLEQAQDRYRRVLEVMNWMPPSMELPELRKTAEESLNRVRGKIEKINEEVTFVGRSEALRQADERRVRETEQFILRINKLLDQVKALYEVQDYKGAEQMSLRVLILDPMNASAEKWKKKARAAYHSHEDEIYKESYREEYKSAMEDVDQAIISNDALITYPANWDMISRRTDVAFGKRVSEDVWKTELRKKLQRKVSFEFIDTPLADAIEFLRHFANVTMIIDPKVLAANPPAINLRVTDMNLDLALEWILKLAELDYAFQDQAIFISKSQNLQAAVEMRIYDVSDLTQAPQDFPGPEFQIEVAGKGKGGGGGAGAANPFLTKPTGTAPTNQTISDMIRSRVDAPSWAAEQGTSIEERGGRLVVMQRPEVHKLIDKLLSELRSTQKMMINIESRFLLIREAYLEETGVEYQGLDPNVLMGDFGDLRRLGAPTGFIQPRVPGSTNTSPGNLPFPGLVSPPSRVDGGSFSTVGSVINHAINFNPNDTETISSLDPNSTVRNGGLSAQVSILNNTQVQAFIRALAVRENTSTLIAPRLTVFNTQRANMFVARQQSYVADYEISGDSYDPVVRQFLVGVVLDVKPIVSSDRRYVTLELRPTVTELVSFVTRQIDTFTVNSGAQVNVLVFLSFPIQFPELSIRRVRTTATVPDGGIMLVGGLYRNIKFNAENGIPFLSDLPVVGRLFRWNTVDNSKSNLAILVSPRIILFSEEEEKLLR